MTSAKIYTNCHILAVAKSSFA